MAEGGTSCKSIIRDIGLSFLGIMLTMGFEFIVLVATKPYEADSDPNQVFKVQGDLWVAAVAILIGAYWAAADDTKRGKLVPGFVTLLITLVMILVLSVLPGMSYAWVKDMGEWLSIWLPDAIAAITLFVCIHFAQKVR